MSEAAESTRERRRLSVRGATAIITGFAFAAYATTSLTVHSLFENGYDLSIFDQAVRNYSQLQAPVSMILAQDANTLGEHFSPILALLAPLYWIWDDPRMLLLAQAAAVASSIPIVIRFARRHTTDSRALLIGLGYALGWPLQGLFGFDFHEIALGVPLLCLALDALDRRDDRWMIVWSLSLLTVREDMGLILVTIGFIRMLRPPRRWVGAAIIAAGFVGYLVVTAVVIPNLSATGSWKFWTYDALGPDLPSSLKAIVTDPFGAAKLFLTPALKPVTLLMLLVPVCFLALRSPYALIAIPLLAARFWSSRENLWYPYFHYNAVVWVVLVFAAVHALSLVRPQRRELAAKSLAGVIVAVAILGSAVPSVVFPIGQSFFALSPPQSKVVVNEQREALIAQVPAGTCVAGDSSSMSHMLRTNVVGVPGRWTRPADFLLLDRKGPDDAQSDGAEDILRAERDGYVLVDETKRFVLLRHPDYAGPTDQCRP